MYRPVIQEKKLLYPLKWDKGTCQLALCTLLYFHIYAVLLVCAPIARQSFPFGR